MGTTRCEQNFKPTKLKEEEEEGGGEEAEPATMHTDGQRRDGRLQPVPFAFQGHSEQLRSHVSDSCGFWVDLQTGLGVVTDLGRRPLMAPPRPRVCVM